MKAVKAREDLHAQIPWENILTSLEEGVIVINLDGKVSFLNQAAEVLTETSASQATEQPHTHLFRRNAWLIGMIQKSQPPQHNSSRAEGDFVTPWGRQIPVSASVSGLQDHGGQSIGSILLLRDLTRRRELEEDLKRADHMAMLGTLAAGLAHEIKNPLGGIKGAAQLLRRSVGQDPSLIEYTDIMIREVDRVDLLIEQLLDLSRPAKLNLTSLNIHQLLEELLLLQKETIGASKVTLRKNFDPSLPPILGDQAQLTQVFLNLVKNSLEAMRGEGSLTITTRIETDFHIREQGGARENFIRVDVADDGAGIKEEHLPQIFSPFFTTKNHGTGLGLAISYRIVKEHGGLIRVESREGHGTTFRVSLLVAN